MPCAGDNAHLDSVYGGYCVFAQIHPEDDASFAVVDSIAAVVKQRGTVDIVSMKAS